MVLSEYMAALNSQLKARGVKVTPAKVRFAILQERLPRPRMDASHRFDFTQDDIDKAVAFFSGKTREAVSCS